MYEGLGMRKKCVKGSKRKERREQERGVQVYSVLLCACEEEEEEGEKEEEMHGVAVYFHILLIYRREIGLEGGGSRKQPFF